MTSSPKTNFKTAPTSSLKRASIFLRVTVSPPNVIGNNFQLFALESGQVESLKLSFNTFINRQGSEVVMATDDPSQPKQLQEDFAKLSDLLQIQLAKT